MTVNPVLEVISGAFAFLALGGLIVALGFRVARAARVVEVPEVVPARKVVDRTRRGDGVDDGREVTQP